MNTLTKRIGKACILLFFAGVLLYVYAGRKQATNTSFLLLSNVEALTRAEYTGTDCVPANGWCTQNGACYQGVLLIQD